MAVREAAGFLGIQRNGPDHRAVAQQRQPDVRSYAKVPHERSDLWIGINVSEVNNLSVQNGSTDVGCARWGHWELLSEGDHSWRSDRRVCRRIY